MINKFISFFFTVCLFVSFGSYADEFPEKPDRLVNDYADLLHTSDQQALEYKLRAYDDSTSTQIVIAIFNNIGPYDPSDYAPRLAEKWGVGQKGKNNGLLILVVKETHKVFIATGYGMEADLPDATVKRLIETIVIPHFKQGDFYGGLDQLTDAVIQIMAGIYQDDEKGTASNGRALGLFILILLIIVIVSILSKKGGGGNNSGGSRGGWFFPIIPMSSGGFSSRGGYSGGGGGFDGFGGGGFGGGGAGGSW